MSKDESDSDSSRLVTAVLAGMGLMCVVFAAVVLVAPDAVRRAVGYRFGGPAARADFMTVYGGFYLGLGGFWLVCAARSRLHEAGAAALALSSTGAAFARGLGIILLGAVDPQTLVLFAGEVAFTAVGWAAWYATRPGR
jgi:hypothetical protein